MDLHPWRLRVVSDFRRHAPDIEQIVTALSDQELCSNRGWIGNFSKARQPGADGWLSNSK